MSSLASQSSNPKPRSRCCQLLEKNLPTEFNFDWQVPSPFFKAMLPNDKTTPSPPAPSTPYLLPLSSGNTRLRADYWRESAIFVKNYDKECTNSSHPQALALGI